MDNGIYVYAISVRDVPGCISVQICIRVQQESTGDPWDIRGSKLISILINNYAKTWKDNNHGSIVISMPWIIEFVVIGLLILIYWINAWIVCTFSVLQD